jgi:hypothetical protein
VSSELLAIELQRMSPKLNHVDVPALCHQVLCIMKNNNITHRCVTHKAQNVHYEQCIIDDFIMDRYSSDVIINMDETNVDFDPSLRATLFQIREWSVNACISRRLVAAQWYLPAH